MGEWLNKYTQGGPDPTELMLDERNAEIEKQEGELKRLKAEIESLKTRNDGLEETIRKMKAKSQ